MSRDSPKWKHLLRHRESKKLIRAASTSYFPVHLFIWTLWNTLADDKTHLNFLFQQISYLFLLFLELSQLWTPQSQLWMVVHTDVSCSWLRPETVAHHLHLSPIYLSCLAAYVYIQCIWYLAVRSATSKILKPNWRNGSEFVVKPICKEFAIGWVLRNKHLIVNVDSLVIPWITRRVKSDKDGQVIGAQQLRHIRLMKICTNTTLYFECIVWQDLC